jgi:hypothetical protein
LAGIFRVFGRNVDGGQKFEFAARFLEKIQVLSGIGANWAGNAGEGEEYILEEDAGERM